MLVLSRRADQQILFPNLDVKVQVLQVKGKVVKLGIDAPKDLKILRSEVCDENLEQSCPSKVAPGVDRHQLRNRLNTINLGLLLLQKQNDRGMLSDADQTMQRVLDELRALDEEVGTARQKVKKVAGTRPQRLLLVEDDDNERELLAGLLRMHGFDVAAAEDGLAAIEYLGTHEPPDFVLLDMNMPRIDGPATLSQIRANGDFANLKVFGVSGAEPEQLNLDACFDGWFPKPLDPERLIAAMSESDSTTQTSA